MHTLEICNRMKMDITESLEYEPINIGKIIEEELRRQERTVTWLSRKMHCDRRNIYDIFSRTSIDTDLRMGIRLALNTDVSTNLQRFNNTQCHFQKAVAL